MDRARLRPISCGSLVLAVCLLASSASPASAEQSVPEPLRPWMSWALRNHPDALCPTLLGANQRRCAWPGPIEISVDVQGATFSQTWRVETDAWVALPGDERMIPFDLRAGGRVAPVVLREGRPVTHLSRGRHRLTGRFVWGALPESILVPQEIAIVSMMVSGARVDAPERDPDGRVWLARRTATDVGERRLDVTVYRKIVDEVPMRLTTWIELRVSGESREEIVGMPLPAGFQPFSLEGPLPARLDGEGVLRARVRPGTHVMILEARAPSPIEQIALPETLEAWPAQEVWVVEARPSLRLVEIDGVLPVDPDQTRLPDEWRRLPAYRLIPSESMSFVERHRGAPESRDRLRLRRDLKLDFDGGGFMVKDQLTGALNEGWRLEMREGIELGRVTVDNRDLLITQREGAVSGVELRQRNLNLTAEGRMPRDGSQLPAVGWNRNLDEVGVTLHLPPGWTLFDAWGVDIAPDTWFNSWTLLDIFLVLILTLGVAHLFGWPFALLAFITLMSTFPESGAPRWLWATVIAFEALRRALPAGYLRGFFRLAHGTTLIILVLVAVPFLTKQVRQGIDPIMERPSHDIEGRYIGGSFGGPGFGDNLRELYGASADALAGMETEMDRAAPEAPRRLSESSFGSLRDFAEELSYKVDPRANTQTGFGMPGWKWRSTQLYWSGPVHPEQSFKLLLLPPWANRTLSFLRALLVLSFFLCVAGLFHRKKPEGPPEARDAQGPPHGKAVTTGVVLALLAMSPGTGAASEVPSDQVLEHLRTHLTRPPACHPSCASLPALSLSTTTERLTVEMSVDVAFPTVVPLAGTGRLLAPDEIRVNGRPAEELFRDGEGRIWLRLDEGRHQVTVLAPLPRAASVQVPLPMVPGRVEAGAQGWTIVGMAPGGRAQGSIELVRLPADDDDEQDPMETDSLPPFILVERSLELGLTWEVVTRVVRQSPTGAAVSLDIPLLEGESVTSSDLQVSQGRARVVLEPRETEVSWRSALDPTAALRLTAPIGDRWTETWSLNVAPVWHVKMEGIPPVGAGNGHAGSLHLFRPWPGELVALDVSRPEPAPGEILTIDSSALVLKPGRRVTSAELSLVLRTSQGGRHPITPPPGAIVDSLRIEGTEHPVRQEESGAVIVPLRPGTQRIVLTWQEERPISIGFSPEEVNLGAPSVNSTVKIIPSAGRWILWTRGPVAGPSVHFWALLAVVLLVSLILSLLRYSPLRFHEWALLGVGLTQLPVYLSVIVAGWLLALGYRKQHTKLGDAVFNLRQMVLALWAMVALGILAGAIAEGLLGSPEMQIAGNASSAASLNWYSDRVAGVLPMPTMISVPMIAYRFAMLFWALWLAFALLRWLRWGWAAFREGGAWRKVVIRVVDQAQPSPQPSPEPTP